MICSFTFGVLFNSSNFEPLAEHDDFCLLVKRKLMASRAILRRRRLLSDYLNVSARSIQNLRSWGNGQSAHYFDSCGFSSTANCICQGLDKRKDHDEVSPINDGFSGLVFFRTKRYSTTVFDYLNRRVDVVPSTSMSLWPYSVHCTSTATAKKPNLGSDDEEELIAKKKSEASPEECDQAVVGLSTAKAKAKAQRLQESQKDAKSVIQRVWATLLGIGPSLRMVASMSRLGLLESIDSFLAIQEVPLIVLSCILSLSFWVFIQGRLGQKTCSLET